MQELRLVLIIVGALAIAALLFHGLWTSRKEGGAKYGDKPLRRLEEEFAGDVDVEDEPQSKKTSRREPEFSMDSDVDPLIDNYDGDYVGPVVIKSRDNLSSEDDYEAPQVSMDTETFEASDIAEPVVEESVPEAPAQDEDFEVIVINVHTSGKTPLVGTKLFDSMQQNGLLYGEMDIFHRHADLSGTGKVLFSVANMMKPGTLQHDDPATFTTEGIAFFMTLPGFGDPDQNFKLMLKTAQQIADDLGANVLDDQRNLMTPDRLAAYRNQIKEFKARNAK